MRTHLVRDGDKPQFDLDVLPVIPSPGRLWRSLKFWIWAVLIILLAAAVPDIVVDYWFFESIGKTSVFWTNFTAQLLLFVVTLVVFAVSDYLPIRRYAVSPTLRDAAIHLGAWSGLFAGWLVSRNWMTLLLWRHAQPFGETDPVFGHDLGFYVFVLPAISTLLGILVAAGVDMALAFLLGRFDQLQATGQFARTDVTLWAKLGMMATPGLNFALTLMGVALIGETFISRYYLLFKENEQSGVRAGAAYLDLEGVFATLNLIHVSVVVEVGLMLAGGFALYRIARHYGAMVDAQETGDTTQAPVLRLQTPVRIGLGLLAFDLVFFAGIVLKQHLVVSPNEPTIQLSYIQRHIDATRKAYRLEDVETVDWRPPQTRLTAAEINASATVRNAPILPPWVSSLEEPPDVQHVRRVELAESLVVYGPMLDIFKQEQSLRPYYDILNVDGVRYEIGGQKKMFVSAVRELPSLAFLGPKEWLRYWGSAALMYTHGFGLVMSPANELDEEGRPRYSMYDIPPKSDTPELAVTEPRVYYGEGMKDDYVLTNIRHLKELDFPSAEFRETGEFPSDVRAGVPVDGLWKRLMLALHTKDLTAFLFSSFIDHARTRVHLYRTPMRRVARIAPFLFVESNNLAFVSETKIEWLVNALTTTEMYPYSFREVLGDKSDERAIEAYPDRIINYGEDSVKVTMNALTGEVHFYKIADDPIINAWDDCYPGLFEKADAMPHAVRSQLNYPLQWFHLQFDDIYKRYHMTNPVEFYNVEDLWDDADEVLGSLGRGLEEYGTRDEMTFSYEGFHALVDPADLPPGSNVGRPGDLQYAMLMPFTPEGQRNMRSLIVALQDPGSYGRLLDLRVPQGVFLPGPEQADTIIDTDSQVNQQVALWVRHASEVIRGHTIVVPVKGDLLYIEPLWISSIQNHLPEIKLFSVVYKGRCVMSTSVARAIEYLDISEEREQHDNELPWFDAPRPVAPRAVAQDRRNP
jgi:uncharacterized membrane protein (UPF0182 family)